MNAGEAVRRLEEIVRCKHLALATGRACGAWVRRYCDFLKELPLHLPGEHKLERFLTIPTKNISRPAQRAWYWMATHSEDSSILYHQSSIIVFLSCPAARPPGIFSRHALKKEFP